LLYFPPHLTGASLYVALPTHPQNVENTFTLGLSLGLLVTAQPSFIRNEVDCMQQLQTGDNVASSHLLLTRSTITKSVMASVAVSKM